MFRLENTPICLTASNAVSMEEVECGQSANVSMQMECIYIITVALHVHYGTSLFVLP